MALEVEGDSSPEEQLERIVSEMKEALEDPKKYLKDLIEKAKLSSDTPQSIVSYIYNAFLSNLKNIEKLSLEDNITVEMDRDAEEFADKYIEAINENIIDVCEENNISTDKDNSDGIYYLFTALNRKDELTDRNFTLPDLEEEEFDRIAFEGLDNPMTNERLFPLTFTSRYSKGFDLMKKLKGEEMQRFVNYINQNAVNLMSMPDEALYEALFVEYKKIVGIE